MATRVHSTVDAVSSPTPAKAHGARGWPAACRAGPGLIRERGYRRRSDTGTAPWWSHCDRRVAIPCPVTITLSGETRRLTEGEPVRDSANRGRVYLRCGCRDLNRRQLGATCPRLADGAHGKWSFAVDIPAGGGPRRTVRRGGFPTRDKAQSALRRFHEGRALGFDGDPNQTLADYLRAWLRTKALTLKPTTVARYRAAVEQDLIPALGAIRLEDLCHDHIAAYAQRELDNGRGRPTVFKILSTLSSALAHAVRNHRLPHNPARPTVIPRPAADERRTWTAEQAVRFLAHCQGVDPQFADLFELIIGTGMRKGEALALHWDHVPTGDRIMSIRYTLSAVGPELLLTTPKTKKSKAWVALSDRVTAALDRRAQTKAPADEQTLHGGHVFHHPDGQPLHPKAVLKRFHELRRQADVPHCTIHDLRHLAATLSMDGGTPMPVVSKTLRHSTLSSTANIYSHLTPQTARGAVDTIARLLNEAERDNHATTTARTTSTPATPTTGKDLVNGHASTTTPAA